MAEIVFCPEGKKIKVDEGTTLLQAARAVGFTVEAPCDGRGSCGKCQVKVSGELSPPNKEEINTLGNLLTTGIRLACQAKIHGSVEVTATASSGAGFVTIAEGHCKQYSADPLIKVIPYRGPQSEYDQGELGQRFKPFFQENYPGLLHELAVKYEEGILCKQVVLKNGKLLDWHYQYGRCCYGVAIDIGTTSVVAELLDLVSGESIGMYSCLNPQTEFGGDVLTRISFAAKQANGTQLLQKKIIEGINRLIEQLTVTAKVNSQDIYEVVVAGNTTMQHLLLGVSPCSLAKAPYRPVFLEQVEASPAKLGLNISERGVVTLLPSAAAFIGADIVAGILAVGLKRSTKTSLFIDIGTNGEIVVCKDGSLVGTSSAAGPALEGMNIICGCRAERGAIEGVAIGHDGAVSLKVIGNCLPKGICGSGLIDLVSELRSHGVITASGRFENPEMLPAVLAARLIELDGRQVFLISREGNIFLTQKDIRQVQLAKGAIATAITLLLKELNIEFEKLDEVIVAGAFGFHLKPASLIGIGLFPSFCQNKIRFVGNTAKEGAKAVLLNRAAAAEVQEIGETVKVMELSLHPKFQDYFVRSLVFPTVR